ncbi:MAG: hypothetical protein WBX22_11300 [Silvibacterium sp.]
MVLAPPPVAIRIRRGSRFFAALQWWHLLSLDAPTVAALWSWSIARAMHIRLPWSAPLLLALGTWLVYVADRILDGLRIKSAAHLRERHFFYMRHRSKSLVATVIGGLVLVWLVATRMTAAARYEDMALFGIALAYFCLIHLCGPLCESLCESGIERWFPKEMVVGIVFAAAVAVPAWSRLEGQRASMMPVVTLFALLCWLNCTAIEKWERSPPAATHLSTTPLPHATTRWAEKHLSIVSCGVALLAAIVCVRSILSADPVAMSLIYLACMISPILLLAFDRSRLGSFDLRIAADAALLTPLLFVLGIR